MSDQEKFAVQAAVNTRGLGLRFLHLVYTDVQVQVAKTILHANGGDLVKAFAVAWEDPAFIPWRQDWNPPDFLFMLELIQLERVPRSGTLCSSAG